ncbi:MAG: hypothetical protein KKA76_01860 [Proteobacteria bacterium]|nr:hypothetical protein [Pseudomonadota bacterium]
MIQKKKTAGFVVALVLTVMALPAWAGITASLENLVGQGSAINSSLDLFTFADQSCSDLRLINRDLENMTASIQTVTAGLTAPLTLNDEDLDALDSLSDMAKEMALNSVRMSMEIQDVEAVADLFEYRAALSAMLELSNDIGTMADRILEMADRILVMADNIGTMAQRILMTQQIQYANIALTQASLLTTQQNMVLLSDSISSIIYNMTLGLLVSDSNTLLAEMTILPITSENMAQGLEDLEMSTGLLAEGIADLSTWMSVSSQGASHYINGDTLTSLADLSNISTGLAFSLEIYAAHVSELAPLTDTVILSDATAAMLRLTADIGVMAGRIMEMMDKIIIMADNIGLMADNIVATQALQQTNIELTQSSLLTAQSVTVTVIKNMGL